MEMRLEKERFEDLDMNILKRKGEEKEYREEDRIEEREILEEMEEKEIEKIIVNIESDLNG